MELVMTPSDKLKLTNMIDQGVGHTLDKHDILDPELRMQEYERVCISILDSSIPEEELEDATLTLQKFLQKKADSLGVPRDYYDEQEEQQ